jgi:hypothetical protein
VSGFEPLTLEDADVLLPLETEESAGPVTGRRTIFVTVDDGAVVYSPKRPR